ncbi:MAG: hypothetical protein NVS3B17_14420 [Vulcanimicrobiaceae bacterium]
MLALPLRSSAATGPIATAHVRGTVTSATATSLVVKTDTGPVVVALDPKVAYIGVTPATVGDIEPKSFIGTTNVDRAGVNTAVEVHIFPESMRGMAEGDYAWDLPSAGRSSAMTNGSVGGSRSSMTNGSVGGSRSSMTNGSVGGSRSSMTNATVNRVDAGRTINVRYKGGTKAIVIPPDAKIVKFDKASKSIVMPGVNVLVIAAKSENKIEAKAVVAGRNGLVPPM